MEKTCCLNVGHNFQLASITETTAGVTESTRTAIFCTKCGETRKLEITPTSK